MPGRSVGWLVGWLPGWSSCGKCIQHQLHLTISQQTPPTTTTTLKTFCLKCLFFFEKSMNSSMVSLDICIGKYSNIQTCEHLVWSALQFNVGSAKTVNSGLQVKNKFCNILINLKKCCILLARSKTSISIFKNHFLNPSHIGGFFYNLKLKIFQNVEHTFRQLGHYGDLSSFKILWGAYML